MGRIILVCIILGLGLILFAPNAKEPTPAQISPSEMPSRASRGHAIVSTPLKNKIFSVAKPNAPVAPATNQRQIASKPSFTVEPGEFRYDRDPENRDYIEEGVSLEDIEREKNQ